MMRQGQFERERDFAKMYKENETYAKLEFREGQILFVKGTWYPTHFLLTIMDGQDTWDINGIIKLIFYLVIVSYNIITNKVKWF